MTIYVGLDWKNKRYVPVIRLAAETLLPYNLLILLRENFLTFETFAD